MPAINMLFKRHHRHHFKPDRNHNLHNIHYAGRERHAGIKSAMLVEQRTPRKAHAGRRRIKALIPHGNGCLRESQINQVISDSISLFHSTAHPSVHCQQGHNTIFYSVQAEVWSPCTEFSSPMR